MVPARAGRSYSPDELQDLYLNLRDQVEELAGRRGLARILEIPRGRRPREDRGYFEQLTWTVFKSGLTSVVVNRKWPNFQRAFKAFSIDAVARFAGRDVARLLRDRGIIRYRAKVEATIHNARAMRAIVDEYGSFRRYLRRFGVDAQGLLYDDLRRRFKHLGGYGVRSFLRRVGEDVFFAHPDTLRVLYRLGLVSSPRASDAEAGQAHGWLVAANSGTRVDVVNRLLTRHGSGYELDDVICAEIPKCHRCRLSHWCWYYREVRTRGSAQGP